MSLTSYLTAPSRDLFIILADGGTLGRGGGGGKENLGSFSTFFGVLFIPAWFDCKMGKISSCSVRKKTMSDIPEDQIINKLYRAGSFAKSPIVCPSCALKLDRVVDECPRCQFSGAIAVRRYPFAAPAMGAYMDTGGVFDPKARQAISDRLTRLEKQFPQVRICFCALELPEYVDLREFGFWLFNASPVPDEEEAKKRPWTILLLLDHVIGRVSVTSGYDIEPFVRDDRWETLLRLEREFFFKRDYREAGLRFIDGAEKILREGANRATLKMGGQMDKKRRGRSSSRKGAES